MSRDLGHSFYGEAVRITVLLSPMLTCSVFSLPLSFFSIFSLPPNSFPPSVPLYPGCL